MKLTDAGVRALKPAARRVEVWDTNGRGFGLRVTPKGTKTWISLFRFQGKTRRISHGVFAPEREGHLSLAAAREKHSIALRKLERGLDPAMEIAQQRAAVRSAPTISEFAAYFMDAKPSVKCAPRKRTFDAYKQLLDAHILPALGHLPIATVKRREVVAVIDRIRASGKGTTANRVQALLVRLFNVALDKGWIDATPLARLRMPSEKPRDRVLTAVELDAVWNATGSCNPLHFAIRFALLTAQRRAEVALARWEDIDLETGVWTIPARVAKNGRAHRVPLSGPAKRVVAAARSMARDGWLFPSPCVTKANIDPNSINRYLARLQAGVPRDKRFTAHDFRRTAATAMEEGGVPREVVGAVLNHTDQSVTARHYARHTYEAEKRAALEQWAKRLVAPLELIRVAA